MQHSRINERISAYRVILISADGDNKGEVLKSAALEMAKNEGLDLVEVSSARSVNGVISPPVCKIMDFGKVQYERQKIEKKQGHAPVQKEIRFAYKTDPHDLGIKKKKIVELLSDGHKVLVAMHVKGRERYVDSGVAKEKFIDFVKELNPDLMVGDISENEKGYNVMVNPSVITKKEVVA